MTDPQLRCVLAGICFGRTPLIKISPKKTWEGFLGGLVLTLAAAWLLADLMSRFQWMICPRTVTSLKLFKAVPMLKGSEVGCASPMRLMWPHTEGRLWNQLRVGCMPGAVH